MSNFIVMLKKPTLPPDMKPLKSNIKAIKPGKLSFKLISESKQTKKTISAIVTEAIIEHIDSSVEEKPKRKSHPSFCIRIDDNLKQLIEDRAKLLGESPHKIIINCLKKRYE